MVTNNVGWWGWKEHHTQKPSIKLEFPKKNKNNQKIIVLHVIIITTAQSLDP